MTFRPLISVCMPVYNAEPYLAEAIGGVLSQTYDNWELVICDNCSTDRSAGIARRFGSDPRVRFVANQRNIGFAANLQKSTSLAKGDLLIVNAADDAMLPEALGTYVTAIEQAGLDGRDVVVMADAYIIDGEGSVRAVAGKRAGRFEHEQRLPDRPPPGEVVQRYSGSAMLADCLPRLELFGWLGSIMFSRALRDRTEGYQGGKWISPDQEFMYEVLALDPPVLYIQQPLFKYRIHGGNQLGTERRQALIKHSMDQYEYTFQYPDAFLARFGASPKQVRRAFIERDCLGKALVELAQGSWTLGVRYLAFSLATYPGIAVRSPRLYLAAMGVATGPLGRPFARAGLAVWRRRNGGK